MKSRTQNLINTALQQAARNTGRWIMLAFVAGAVLALAIVWVGTKIGALAG